jgi:hypothetical protein
MATDKPVGDNARKGAVRKRSQLKTKMAGKQWTERDKTSGAFMANKKDNTPSLASGEINPFPKDVAAS